MRINIVDRGGHYNNDKIAFTRGDMRFILNNPIAGDLKNKLDNKRGAKAQAFAPLLYIAPKLIL
jgi:hypothetical protein